MWGKMILLINNIHLFNKTLEISMNSVTGKMEEGIMEIFQS